MSKYRLYTMFCFLFFAVTPCEAQEGRFDWGTVVNYQKGVNFEKGNQILHYRSYNSHYLENEDSQRFVDQYLRQARPCTSDAEVLKFASDSVTIDGVFVELGVCTGTTINFIAALNPHHQIYGFDSFEGLPEDWELGNRVIPKGSLGMKDPAMLPPVLHNVQLIKGWFDDTLPDFVKTVVLDQAIAFLHVDCDLYSSTASAFKCLGRSIKPGTIIVFDEFYNYPNYENHEFKAFSEFLEEHSLKAEFLGYNTYHQQVAVRILDESGSPTSTN